MAARSSPLAEFLSPRHVSERWMLLHGRGPDQGPYGSHRSYRTRPRSRSLSSHPPSESSTCRTARSLSRRASRDVWLTRDLGRGEGSSSLLGFRDLDLVSYLLRPRPRSLSLGSLGLSGWALVRAARLRNVPDQ